MLRVVNLISYGYLVEDVEDADIAGDNDAQRHHQSHDEHENDVTASIEPGYKIALDYVELLLLLVPIH